MCIFLWGMESWHSVTPFTASLNVWHVDNLLCTVIVKKHEWGTKHGRVIIDNSDF